MLDKLGLYSVSVELTYKLPSASTHGLVWVRFIHRVSFMVIFMEYSHDFCGCLVLMILVEKGETLEFEQLVMLRGFVYFVLVF